MAAAITIAAAATAIAAAVATSPLLQPPLPLPLTSPPPPAPPPPPLPSFYRPLFHTSLLVYLLSVHCKKGYLFSRPQSGCHSQTRPGLKNLMINIIIPGQGGFGK
jgi:hypothetical protein